MGDVLEIGYGCELWACVDVPDEAADETFWKSRWCLILHERVRVRDSYWFILTWLKLFYPNQLPTLD